MLRSIRVPRIIVSSSSPTLSSSLLLITQQRSFFGPFKKKAPQEQSSSSEEQQSMTGKPQRSNPFAAMPNAPKTPSPLSAAKDVYKMTKAARQMSKEAQKLQEQAGKGGGGVSGMNPLKGMTESQMAQFRTVLELQKKMAGEISNGKIDDSPMGKMMKSSSEMLEKMLDPMEKAMSSSSQQDGKPTTKQIAEEALKGNSKLPPPPTANFSRGQAHQQEQQQQQKQQPPSFKSVNPNTPPPPPPTPGNMMKNNDPNSSVQQGSGLAPEVEALFQELREMRAKKNFYRDKSNEAEKELITAKSSLKQAQQQEADLRKRLGSAEHTVALLQSESLDLRDKKKELTGQLKQANTELIRSKPKSTSLAEQQKRLETELTAVKKQNNEYQKEIARLDRKISRLRKHSSPINDLSELLQEFSKVGTDSDIVLPLSLTASDKALDGGVVVGDGVGVASSSSSLLDDNNNTTSRDAASSSTSDSLEALDSNHNNDSIVISTEGQFRSSVVDEAFSSVRDKYEQLTSLRFEQEDAQSCGVSAAIVGAALELIRARVPHVLLDCSLTVPTDDGGKAIGEVKRLIEERNQKVKKALGSGSSSSGSSNSNNSSSTSIISGDKDWEIRIIENKGLNTASVVVSDAADADTPSTGLGPFGYFATFIAYQQAISGSKNNNNSNTNNNSSSILSNSKIQVHPYLSTALVNNPKRSKIITDKARSSKPGGQASNVGETKITHRLTVDGLLVTSAVSQDSRSAMDNKHTAMDRLLTERLPVANQKLKHLPQLSFIKSSSSSSSSNNSIDEHEMISDFLKNHRAGSLKSSLESLDQECGALIANSVKFSILSMKNREVSE